MSVCTYVQAQSGDGCYSLAQRCLITQDDLIKYNPSNGFCSSVKIGDYVCCSAGSKPDFSPRKSSDGSCFAYTAQTGDTCAAIASAHSILDWNKINDWNNNTWGWAGCDHLQLGARFCLSDGTPPFPQPLQGALCGPQVPGTQQPAALLPRYWADLNPCPLNACCDIWGQCGVTPEFCTVSPADTLAPGTAKPGQNGCISNCGLNITGNGATPDHVRRIGYFEAFNGQRDCLTMNISDFDTTRYTHVHFAFADLTDTWDVDTTKVKDQIPGLVSLQGVKRILSFGGWSFSTDARTQAIFRNGVKPENRGTFARKVVDYIVSMGLDGVDFDWEYPGAQDIPGIPADSIYSGPYYLGFLKTVRYLLPPDKSLSIAAPASYWYLKNFPIKEIATVVDYIVYMTYDLHGQWDYGNKWVDPGCANGDCLRHQTNDTEVKAALAMITKASVEAKKIVVGMPLYGRSFKMAQALCSGPSCQYTGPTSGAMAGRCTKTAGYISNSEIREIIDSNSNVVQYYDQGDIVIYNNTEWISWMSDSSYKYKQAYYDSLNFGGTSDWAVDLDQVLDLVDDTPDDSEPSFNENFYSPCTAQYKNIDDVQKDQNEIPRHCLQQYLTDALIAMWDGALTKYQDLVNDGYDSKFSTYASYISDQVPKQLETFMDNKTLNHIDDLFSATLDSNGAAAIGVPSYCAFVPDVMGNKDSNTVSQVTYTLKDSDGFFSRLGDATGILKDWITFGNYVRQAPTPCPGSTDKLPCKLKHEVDCANLPKPGTITVPNPKDVVSKSYSQSQDMLTRLKRLRQILQYDKTMDYEDLVDAASLPALAIVAAVEQMDKAAATGAELQEEQRKELIMAFLTGIMFFIPFVGEAAGAVGLTTVKLTLQLVDITSGVAFTIYGVVSDPKNIMGDIFAGLLVAGIGRAAWSKAADTRRLMTTTDLSKLGSIGDRMSTISNAEGRMCRL